MMVVTGFSPAGAAAYGLRFLETFDRCWPAEIGLAAYTEEAVAMPRGECRSLWDCCGATTFFERHRRNPAHCGKSPVAGWRTKDRQAGYSWRFDAVRFFRQCLIPHAAGAMLPDGEVLAWLDADVVTFAPVAQGFVEGLIGDADLVYLGRAPYHSEIGFWAVRLNPLTRRFLGALAGLYRSDGIFGLAQWHSAFAFDHCRAEAERQGLLAKNLTPGGNGHVWVQSPLAACLDHLKGGRRKALGYSPERFGQR